MDLAVPNHFTGRNHFGHGGDDSGRASSYGSGVAHGRGCGRGKCTYYHQENHTVDRC